MNISFFETGPKKHLAIRGVSGSGKTTFLHCISGMISADSGEINVLGTNLSALTESKRDRFRANHIGYIFQSFNLLDGFTALENVMLGMQFSDKGADRERAELLLEKAGLKDRMFNRPSQLSVGQQQRVCIARALANNPEILLADEPTGSLDPKTSAAVLNLIRTVAEDKTLILVSHEPEVLQQFDSVTDLNEINQTAQV